MAITPEQTIFLIILAGTFVLLLTEWLRTDVVAVLVILALYIGRVLEAKDALSGFGSEPAITVAGIFVLSAAINQTGLSGLVGEQVGRLAGKSFTQGLVVIMLSVSFFSVFMHHVMTTAVMLPVTLQLARERNWSPSRLLMPLSFAASLGTTVLLISAPAFLVANSVLVQNGRPGLSIFAFAPIGIALVLGGTLFMALIGRFLPEREAVYQQGQDRFRFDKYFTELGVGEVSPVVGKTLAEVKRAHGYRFTVVGWVRGGRPLREAFHKEALAAGDVLLVHTTPEDMAAFRHERIFTLRPVEQYGPPRAGREEEGDNQLVQAVVAPNSDLVGRTLGEIDFRRTYGPIVVGFWRQSGWVEQELAHIPLRSGDVLVLQGGEEDLARVGRDSAFLMLVPFHGEAKLRGKAWLSGLILVATIAAAATSAMSVEMACLTGAAASVLSGCLSVRQAYRAIDTRIYVFIAGAIPLGLAMQKTGTAELLARMLQNLVAGWPEWAILFMLFIIVGIITQFMSDAGTTALFAPIAAALALALGHAPEPYVVTTAIAAVASFFTPIGHHGNLIVYGPGGYRFSDFVIVGTPLTLLVGAITVLIAPHLWPSP